MNRLSVWITCLLLTAFVAAGTVVGLLWAPLNPDAGLFIPLARQIARGQMLYTDLPCDYPPLPPYALALLGERGLAHPPAVIGTIVAVQLINAGLLAWLVGRLGHATSVRWLAAAVYLAWLWCCEGTAVVLEPWVNFGLIAAALAATWPGWLAALLCGLATGLALASKQFAVLALPGLFLWLLAGRLRIEPSPERPRPRLWLRVLLWSMGAVGPFLALAFATGQRPDQLVAHLATFGGRAYGTWGLQGLFVAITTGRPAAPLAALAILAAWLCLSQRRLRDVALVLLLAGLCVPLIVRDYPHYVQLPAAWGVVVLIETASMVGRRFSGHERGTGELVVWGSLLFVTLWLATAAEWWNQAQDRPRAAQHKLAAASAPLAAPDKPLLIVGGAWLAALVDLPAPGGDYRFVPALTDAAGTAAADERTAQLLQKSATLILVGPTDEGTADWLTGQSWRRLAAPAQIGPWPLAVYRQPAPSGDPPAPPSARPAVRP